MYKKGNPLSPSGSDLPSAGETIRNSMMSKILSVFGASQANYDMPKVIEEKMDSPIKRVRRRVGGAIR